MQSKVFFFPAAFRCGKGGSVLGAKKGEFSSDCVILPPRLAGPALEERTNICRNLTHKQTGRRRLHPPLAARTPLLILVGLPTRLEEEL